MNRLSIILIIALMLIGCTSDEKSQYQSISADGWRYGDTLTLTPVRYEPDTAKISNGNVSLVIRHTNNYEYSNLWLRLDYANADTVVTDTVNVVLADDFGNWLGKGIGVSFQQSQTVLYDVDVDLSQPIKVTHVMRADTLRGIEQVGLVIKGRGH